MCRSIKTLFNFDPPVTDEEIRAASLQFVRKLSGFHKPSQANEPAFERAVAATADVARELLQSLVTNGPPRDREVEARKARQRAAARFGRGAAAFLLATIAASAAPGAAQEPDAAPIAARIDSVFAEYATSEAPGCAIGVARNGTILIAKGYGAANLEHPSPNTERTPFNVGSLGKQFTAFAALLLERDGRLSLEDDIRRWVPEFPDYGTPIRVRDLLHHTSGLRDSGTLALFAGRRITTMDDFVDLLSRQRGLNFTPGTRHEYSHSDYTVLALVVERASGMPFGAYLEREIWQPLGMTSTSLHDGRRAPIPGRAMAYSSGPKGHRVRFPVDEIIGGNNLYTSVEDFLRWEGNFRDARVGGREVIDRMLERPKLPSGAIIPYAYGLQRGTYRGLPTIQRSGGGGGFAAELLRFPKEGLSVVTFCNVTPSHPRYLSRDVADVFLEGRVKKAEAETAPRGVTPPAGEAARLAGVYRPAEDPWNVMRLEDHGGVLHEAFPDTSLALVRLSDGRWFGEGLYYEFEKSRKGPPQHAALVTDESRESLERSPSQEPWRPEEAALTDYTGLFWSEDVSTAWEIHPRGGRLLVRRRGERDEPLVPIEPDIFVVNLGTGLNFLRIGFEFIRDNDGRVSGFTASALPWYEFARDVLFEKVREN